MIPMPKSPGLLMALIAVLVAATFAVDLATPRGVAAGVFPYFLAIFLAAWLPWPRGPFAVAAVTCLLAIIGFLSTSGGNTQIILLNRLLIFAALWLAAGLAYLRIKSDQETHAAHRQLEQRVACPTLGQARALGLGRP
jgi:hypothetical protein